MNWMFSQVWISTGLLSQKENGRDMLYASFVLKMVTQAVAGSLDRVVDIIFRKSHANGCIKVKRKVRDWSFSLAVWIWVRLPGYICRSVYKHARSLKWGDLLVLPKRIPFTFVERFPPVADTAEGELEVDGELQSDGENSDKDSSWIC